MKKCTICNIEKELDNFYKEGDGHRRDCKSCCNARQAIYKKKNYLKYQENWNRYALQNKDRRKQLGIIWRNKNREKLRQRAREYYREPGVKERNIRQKILRSKTDIHYRLKLNISNLIRSQIKRNKNYKKSVDILGYSINELKTHLEKQFTDGMNWQQILDGQITVDHKIPQVAFGFNTYAEDGFKLCWSLDNLQPLLKSDNASKMDRMPDGSYGRDLKEKIKTKEQLNYWLDLFNNTKETK